MGLKRSRLSFLAAFGRERRCVWSGKGVGVVQVKLGGAAWVVVDLCRKKRRQEVQSAAQVTEHNAGYLLGRTCGDCWGVLGLMIETGVAGSGGGGG